MKALLVLCLVAICSCTEPIEIVKCFLSSDVIFKGISKIIDAIETKDMMKVVGVITGLFRPFKDEVMKCLGKEVALTGKVPDWVIKVAQKIGQVAITVWNNGGCQAVKSLCASKFGPICSIIPC